MVVLIFATQSDAETALGIINQMAENWLTTRGYTVVTVDERRMGVAKDGQGSDQPLWQMAESWAEVSYNPAYGYWFKSLSARPEYDGWKDTYAAFNGPAYSEQDIPFADLVGDT